VGVIGFLAAVLFFLMALGHWQENHNAAWLAAAVIVGVGTLISLFVKDD
jgi:hypothetical protein